MNKRIIIDIAPDEFEFIKAAIEYKAKTLLNYLDVCKEYSEENETEDWTKTNNVVTRKRK